MNSEFENEYSLALICQDVSETLQVHVVDELLDQNF